MNKESDKKTKYLRSGFTTGSAATAAAKAALIMLITKEEINSVEIDTPSGIKYFANVYHQEINYKRDNGEKTLCQIDENTYSKCCVKKDSGDDPDVTDGIEIYAKVSFTNSGTVEITGGEGVGKITRPGLDQPVGEYAINSTPRKMITETLQNILFDNDIEAGLKVEISIPKGMEIYEKTFNPHMGIEGGISIIGTTGIVKPMSTEALLDTIRLDIKMQYSEGRDTCIIVPGNYGVSFLEKNYKLKEKEIVLCSNFVGDSMRFAIETGFKNILFCSHIGKMIKVSGGMMNTHSMYGDRRMELMCQAYIEACIEKQKSFDEDVINHVMECVSTTAALDVLNEIDMVTEVSKIIVHKTVKKLEEVCDNKASIKCILYENNYGELARSF